MWQWKLSKEAEGEFWKTIRYLDSPTRIWYWQKYDIYIMCIDEVLNSKDDFLIIS